MRAIRVIAWAVALLLPAVAASAQGSYQIRPGDTLGVEVLEDPSLNRSVVVLPDGRVSFPFAGTVPAAGLTVEQVQERIKLGIGSKFATPPNVFVSVQPSERATRGGGGGGTATRGMKIYFLGEVAKPGRVDMPRGTTLLQALAEGGGFSKFAATKRVQLRRTDPRTGMQKVYPINYKAIVDGAVATTDIELRDGDIIVVPERRLFE